MAKRSDMILGVNHQFLYAESMRDGRAHARTLAVLADDPRVEALDCWLWASESANEARALNSSGKWINYNIGDRFEEAPLFPASPDARTRAYTLDRYRREFDFALEVGAHKIIMGSGPDVAEDRAGATKRLEDFVGTLLTWIPSDVLLTIEPTDRDIDKRFLFGPLDESVASIKRVRAAGGANYGMLLDMSHIPILHETIADAVAQSADTLMHVHLGNAIISDPTHPLYGDRHPSWCHPAGAYFQKDVNEMIACLRKCGYLATGKRPTITFEMRVFDGLSPVESLDKCIAMLDEALI